ncbi:MAG: 3-hydroxyacyl-CoA dehydrogenase family protein [Chloroflexi bacterium]|nr:3-hydroxyacyl-CoA dehydrogenase family protein [Chloroflexota bacterium]
MSAETIGVLGAGLMGHGIAQVFAAAGHPVVMVDADPTAFDRARAKIRQNLDLQIEYEWLDAAAADAVLPRISTSTDLAALAPADLVIEAVAEDAEIKREVYGNLAPHLRPETILATNTSSIPIRVLADATDRPDRFTTTHFFRPAYIIPMVEVTKGEQTSEATVTRVLALLRGAGLRPVRINVDLPGQVANRLRQALFREALDLVERGVISAEDIDELAGFSFGPRMPLMGVIRDRDLVGLDITARGAERVWPDLSNASEPHASLRDLAAEGHLGLKTGRGFCDWSDVDFAAYWTKLERQQLEIFGALRRADALPSD